MHVLLCAPKQKQSDGCDKGLPETRLSELPEDRLISFLCCSLMGRVQLFFHSSSAHTYIHPVLQAKGKEKIWILSLFHVFSCGLLAEGWTLSSTGVFVFFLSSGSWRVWRVAAAAFSPFLQRCDQPWVSLLFMSHTCRPATLQSHTVD